MPSFPHPDSVTICEINRDLITAENLSDDQAKEAYGKALGITFTPIPFQCDYLVNTHDSNIAQNKTVLQAILSGSLETLFRPTDARLLPEVVFHGISWHQHKHIIAFTSGPNQVTVCDYYDSGMSSVFRWCRVEVQSEQNFLCQFHFLKTFSLPVEIDIPTSSALFSEGKDTCNFLWQFHFFKTFSLLVEIDIPTSPVLFPEGKDTCILNSESQRGVKALEWRPNGGRTLSVACKGGICIWSASYPGNAAPVRSGVIPGNISGSSGIRWTLVDFLRGHADEQVTALSWSPDGRYLASASCESSSFMIWDVAQGLGTPIRRGLGGISMLRWSPTGDYFFAAKFDGTFYLWETSTWTSELWSSTSGLVTGASWDPDGNMILIAFSESSTLGSIHFASKPPSLDAHLLPIELHEIKSLTLSRGIEKIAWDTSGERLALSYKDGEELYKGLIAIYDVKRTPLISASLVGFIRGPGDNVKPISFTFHDKFKQGALLSVCWSSGFCCTYPLIFH